MNRTEFIKELGNKLNLKRADAKNVVDTFESIVLAELSNGGKVTMTGFGTFDLSDRKERKGRNPQTNEEIIIPAHEAPVFRFADGVKKSFR